MYSNRGTQQYLPHQHPQYPQYNPNQRQQLSNDHNPRIHPPSTSLENPQLQTSSIDPTIRRGQETSSHPASYVQFNTQNDHNRIQPHQSENPRYSFIQTPIEMQSPGFSRFEPSEPAIAQSPNSPTAPANHPEALVVSPISPRGPSPMEPAPPSFDPTGPIPSSPDQVPVKNHRESLMSPKSFSPAAGETKKSRDALGLTGEEQHAHALSAAVPDNQYAPPPRMTYNPNSPMGPNGILPETHQPGQIGHPSMYLVNGEWNHQLCECGDVETCCTGFWCPCILYGRTQYRLTQKRLKKDPTDLLGYKAVNGQCGLMCAACGFQWLLTLFQHMRIRTMFNMEGSIGQDCVTSFCCYCCTLMQDERELRHKEGELRRLAGPASGASGATAYMSPQGMSFNPPPGPT